MAVYRHPAHTVDQKRPGECDHIMMWLFGFSVAKSGSHVFDVYRRAGSVSDQFRCQSNVYRPCSSNEKRAIYGGKLVNGQELSFAAGSTDARWNPFLGGR